jgi:hypothetical protein
MDFLADTINITNKNSNIPKAKKTNYIVSNVFN